MHGRNVCYMHGGKTPIGVAAPSFKHGRYSKTMPEALRTRYEELRQDEELLSLHEAIALVNALISDTLGEMSRKEGGALWLELKETFTLFEGEWAQGDKANTAEMALYLRKMKRIIGEGAKDYMARQEVMQQTLVLGKLVDKEGKRREREQQTITVERMMVFVRALAESVRRHVTDERALAAIASDILVLTGGGLHTASAALPGGTDNRG